MYMGVLAMPCPSDWVLYCCCLIRFCRPIRLCFGNVACSPEFRYMSVLAHAISWYLAPSCTHSWFHVQLGFVWNWCRPKSYGSLSVPLLQVPFALISHYLPLSPMFRQTKKWIDATLITNVCGDFETADVLDLMGINSMNQTLRAITLCWGIKPYSIHCSHSTILILIHIYI